MKEEQNKQQQQQQQQTTTTSKTELAYDGTIKMLPPDKGLWKLWGKIWDRLGKSKTHKKRKDPNFDYKKYLERNSLHCQTWRGWATHLVKYIADLLATFSPISKQCPLSVCSNWQDTKISIREPHTFPMQYNKIRYFLDVVVVHPNSDIYFWIQNNFHNICVSDTIEQLLILGI